MLSAVNFNDQSLLQTDKINDAGSDGTLPAKFVPVKLAQTKMMPKQAFRVCRIAS
jgi:hypothetical protein